MKATKVSGGSVIERRQGLSTGVMIVDFTSSQVKNTIS